MFKQIVGRGWEPELQVEAVSHQNKVTMLSIRLPNSDRCARASADALIELHLGNAPCSFDVIINARLLNNAMGSYCSSSTPPRSSTATTSSPPATTSTTRPRCCSATCSAGSRLPRRQHPVLPAAPGFVRKVKPLVRLGERETAAYACRASTTRSRSARWPPATGTSGTRRSMRLCVTYSSSILLRSDKAEVRGSNRRSPTCISCRVSASAAPGLTRRISLSDQEASSGTVLSTMTTRWKLPLLWSKPALLRQTQPSPFTWPWVDPLPLPSRNGLNVKLRPLPQPATAGGFAAPAVRASAEEAVTTAVLA